MSTCKLNKYYKLTYEAVRDKVYYYRKKESEGRRPEDERTCDGKETWKKYEKK
ncbi:hypothetical protein [Brotaphodocola sp.]|uniref:hypothetical protein n=1 Tax=Brotaphodocola sp. TaxID=3073577 RepID=UPI003D7F1592